MDFNTVITRLLLTSIFTLTFHLWLNWNSGRVGYFHVHFCDLPLGMSLFLLEMDPLRFTLTFIFAHELQAGISWTKDSQSYKHVTQESGEHGGLISKYRFCWNTSRNLEIARMKLILHFWWGTLGKMQLMLRKAAKALYAVRRIHMYLFSHLKKTILAKTYSER